MRIVTKASSAAWLRTKEPFSAAHSLYSEAQSRQSAGITPEVVEKVALSQVFTSLLEGVQVNGHVVVGAAVTIVRARDRAARAMMAEFMMIVCECLHQESKLVVEMGGQG